MEWGRTSLVGQLIGLVRLVASFAAQLFYRPSDAVAEEYHKVVLRQLSVDEDHLYGDQLLETSSAIYGITRDPERVATIPVIEFGTATRARRCILPTSQADRPAIQGTYRGQLTQLPIQEPGANQMF